LTDAGSDKAGWLPADVIPRRAGRVTSKKRTGSMIQQRAAGCAHWYLTRMNRTKAKRLDAKGRRMPFCIQAVSLRTLT